LCACIYRVHILYQKIVIDTSPLLSLLYKHIALYNLKEVSNVLCRG